MTDQDTKTRRARLTGDQRMAVVIEKQEREVARLQVKMMAASATAEDASQAYEKANMQLRRFKAAAGLES